MSGINKSGCLGEDGVEDLYKFADGWDGNGAESVFEVREDVRDGVSVDYFDKVNVVLYSIVEAVEVDEVDWGGLVVLELSYFAGA